MNKRFAVFVLSHGRIKTISTIDNIIRQGYTGDWFVVIDDEDSQEEEYINKFSEHIIKFNKKHYADIADLGDLDTDRRIGVLARNFIQDESKRLGYKYHLQLDDDITYFAFRFRKGNSLKNYLVKDLDSVFDAICDYMDECPFTSLSLGSGQYLFGGYTNNNYRKGMIPKTMTTFFMRADDIEYFKFRMNDDITTSALNNMIGKMYYTILSITQHNSDTQSQSGGMTEIYKENGTYRKSFYTVMALPSCSYIAVQGLKNLRMHHEIIYNNCVPKIISDKYKKLEGDNIERNKQTS
jgi:hypothetical protein